MSGLLGGFFNLAARGPLRLRRSVTGIMSAQVRWASERQQGYGGTSRPAFPLGLNATHR